MQVCLSFFSPKLTGTHFRSPDRKDTLTSGLRYPRMTSHFLLTGIAASFAVKLFKAWMAEKDANSVTSSLRKANLDKRLLVSIRTSKVVCW